MNSGRSADMPVIVITNLTTGKIIYTGYGVKGFGAGNVEGIDYSVLIYIIIAIVIMIIIALYAFRGG